MASTAHISSLPGYLMVVGSFGGIRRTLERSFLCGNRVGPGYEEVAPAMGSVRTRSGEAEWTTIDWSKHVRDLHHDGRRIRYVDIGKGRPIVLLHGLGASWQSWLENLPALSRGHRVIAIDLPGFGCSDSLPPEADIDAHIESVDAVLTQLRLSSVVVVGHSMGGLIALRFAADRPARVGGLVLLSGGGVAFSATRLALVTRGFTAFDLAMGIPKVPDVLVRWGLLRNAILRSMVVNPASLSPELAAEVLPGMHSEGLVRTLLAAVRGLAEVDPAAVRCPTLLIWGARDRIIPVAAAKQLAADLPDARLAVVDGVGHCAMLEDPATFNALLQNFVADPARSYSTSEYRYLEIGAPDSAGRPVRSDLAPAAQDSVARRVRRNLTRRTHSAAHQARDAPSAAQRQNAS
ncbi:alpha/beta fold hydrolase [Nocardia terrae]|uniref:alpha/beta fold hydrolase n=1 Tax=Nocardia terrae TaxID=2675851 RepID=UPI0012FCA9B9|nr:alpha/beta fold hydrolase [Nocardia terrae]